MAELQVPPKIAAIIELLHIQDNRITSNPIFAVQQKRVIYGLDEGYASNHRWVDYDGECSQEDANLYDAKRENGEPLPDGVRRLGLIETWEFVTGCMTEQGCKDFIACNGHNLREPRIYAYSGYRNAEFIAVREWLMSLRPADVAGTFADPTGTFADPERMRAWEEAGRRVQAEADGIRGVKGLDRG